MSQWAGAGRAMLGWDEADELEVDSLDEEEDCWAGGGWTVMVGMS